MAAAEPTSAAAVQAVAAMQRISSCAVSGVFRSCVARQSVIYTASCLIDAMICSGRHAVERWLGKGVVGGERGRQGCCWHPGHLVSRERGAVRFSFTSCW